MKTEIKIPNELTSYQEEILDMIQEFYPEAKSITLESHEYENKELRYPTIRRIFHVFTDKLWVRFQLVPLKRIEENPEIYADENIIGDYELIFQKRTYLLVHFETEIQPNRVRPKKAIRK